MNAAEEQELKTAVAILRNDLDGLAEDFKDHVRKQNGSLDKIWTKLDEMSGRPTWGVTVALGIMGSALVGLSVALLKG